MNQDNSLDQQRAKEALTETVQHRLCEAARVGVIDRFAAGYAGIPYRWLRRWLKVGKRVKEPQDTYQQQCKRLTEALEKARSDYVVNTFYKIEKTGHWQALAWKLKQFLAKTHVLDAQNQHQKRQDLRGKKQETFHAED